MYVTSNDNKIWTASSLKRVPPSYVGESPWKIYPFIPPYEKILKTWTSMNICWNFARNIIANPTLF